MKPLSTILPLIFVVLCGKGPLYAQTTFEGTLTTRVTVAGVDMSLITEKIDYGKGDVKEQIAALYQSIPVQDISRLQVMMEQNPMMGLVMMMTPPQATIHVKGNIAFAKTRGLGYEIQHYHNEQADEAFLYTASLIQPDEAVTANYKPSQGYDALFTADKRISPDNFNVEHSSKTAEVAGYNCAISMYTPKSLQPESAMGMPSVQLHKLVVYTSKDLPKGINFSHPYYLPEDDGILRIDIYLDNGAEPTMVYEMVSVTKTVVNDSMLVPKKTEPLYALTDMNYGMKVLAIMMGGMSVMDSGDEDYDEEGSGEEY